MDRSYSHTIMDEFGNRAYVFGEGKRGKERAKRRVGKFKWHSSYMGKEENRPEKKKSKRPRNFSKDIQDGEFGILPK